jgi:hypothetical protein
MPKLKHIIAVAFCLMLTLSLAVSYANEGKVLNAFPYGDASQILRLTQNATTLPASKELNYAMARPPQNIPSNDSIQTATLPNVSQIHLPNLRRENTPDLPTRVKRFFHIRSSRDASLETAYIPSAVLPAKPRSPELSSTLPANIALAAVGVNTSSNVVSLPLLWDFSRRPRPNHRERIVMRLIRETNPKWSEHEAHTLAFLILKTSETHRIDYRILSSLIATESSFRLDAVSRTGAKGLGQLKDATAEWLGVRNSFDPIENLNGTAKYLSFLADQFPNDSARAVASYNVGQGTVKREGLNEPAIRYILKVQNYLDLLLAWGAD